MPAPTTLSAYWSAELARLDAALLAQRAALANAQATQQSAQNDYTQTGDALDAARKAVDAARKALGGIAMPADSDPLLQQMRDAVLQARVQAALYVQRETALRDAQALCLRLGARLDALQARRSAAQAARDAEDKARAQRQDWISSAGSGALKDVPAQAAALIAGVGAAAKAKIEADFPGNADPKFDLLTRVRARRQLGAKLLTLSRDDASEAQRQQRLKAEACGRDSDKTAGLKLAFEQAVAALQNLALAPPRLARDEEVLTALAARSTSPLTAAQAKVFKADGDAALRGEREAALKLLKDRDEAQAALLDAQAAYARALRAAQIAKPDASEAALIAADAALKTLHDKIDPAQTTLNNAVAALAPKLALLRSWFAAASDALWDPLDTLDAALDELDAFKKLVPATLISNLSAAEAALAGNLDAVSAEQRGLDLLTQGLGESADALRRETELSTRRAGSVARFVAAV